MLLFFHLLIHIILSLAAGFVVFKIWGKYTISILFTLAAGVFVDLDHLIDYFLAFGMNFRADYFFTGYQFFKNGKIYILFHAWEYVIIALVLAAVLKNKVFKSAFLAIALGLFFHLSADSVIDNMPARSYFLIYRIENRFELENLVGGEHYRKYLIMKKAVNFR